MAAYENGTLWKAPFPLCWIALLQVLPDAKFCLLAYGEASHGGTCLNVITDPDGSGKWQYDPEEIEGRLAMWEFLPGQSLEVSNYQAIEDAVDHILQEALPEMPVMTEAAWDRNFLERARGVEMLLKGTLKSKEGLIPLNQCPRCGYLIMQGDMNYEDGKPVICRFCDEVIGQQAVLLKHIIRVIPEPENVTNIAWNGARLHFDWHGRRFIAAPNGAVIELYGKFPSSAGLLLEQLLKLTKEDK